MKLDDPAGAAAFCDRLATDYPGSRHAAKAAELAARLQTRRGFVILAVLGGSFDPVHAGHVAMVAHVLRHRLADRVLIIPNWRSPWRDAPLAGPR